MKFRILLTILSRESSESSRSYFVGAFGVPGACGSAHFGFEFSSAKVVSSAMACSRGIRVPKGDMFPDEKLQYISPVNKVWQKSSFTFVDKYARRCEKSKV